MQNTRKIFLLFYIIILFKFYLPVLGAPEESVFFDPRSFPSGTKFLELEKNSQELLNHSFVSLEKERDQEGVYLGLKECQTGSRQLVVDIVFKIILQSSYKEEVVLRKRFPSVIQLVSIALAGANPKQFANIFSLSQLIFDSLYEEEESPLKLEDRLKVFEYFLQDSDHLNDKESHSNLLKRYYIIYNSLQEIGVNINHTEESYFSLSEVVRNFRSFSIKNLKNLCLTVEDTYHSDCFKSLEKNNGSLDWINLAEELKELPLRHRTTLSSFINYLPRTFSVSPDITVQNFKRWIKNINFLRNFEEIGQLAKECFHERVGDQIEILQLILLSKVEGLSNYSTRMRVIGK